MRIICGPGRRHNRSRPSIITIGVFDGVHLGHQTVLGGVVAEARKKGLSSVAVTFALHPSHILQKHDKTPHLMSLRHKLRYIAKAGIDICHVLYFDHDLASMPPERFIDNILLKRIRMVSLHVGEDFVFGRSASGDTRFLERMSAKYGFGLHVHRHLAVGNEIVSSTLIRRLISSGEISRAQKFLGRPVSLMGRVIRGEARGRRLGFPTANISLEHEALLPDGIYAAWALTGKKIFPAAAYIGTKPTFHRKKGRRQLEVFVLDARQDFYRKTMEVFFVRRIRRDRKFKNSRSLSRQISKDIARAKNILSARKPFPPIF